MKRLGFLTALLLIVLASGLALAGNLYPPGLPEDGSHMCTLDELYDYLALGIYPESHEGFQEPGAWPGPTMKTLQEILQDSAALFNQAEAEPANVLEGVSFFSTKASIWGPQQGTLPKKTLSAGRTSVEAGYYQAADLTQVDPDLKPGNIKSMVSIFGVQGTYDPTCPTCAGTAAVGDVLAGKTFSSGGKTGLVGTMLNHGPADFDPGRDPVTVPAGYYSGGQVNGDANLDPANIKYGVDIFGQTGAFPNDGTAVEADVLSAKTFYSNNGTQKTGSIINHGPADFDPGKDPVTVPAGYYSGGQVNGDANLDPANIKYGVDIFGQTGSFPNDGTAVESDVLSAKTFYSNNGTQKTGSITNHGPADFDPGKDPVTVPAGYYSGGQVNGDANLDPANIKYGVDIFGRTGSFPNDGTAVEADVLSAKTFYSNNGTQKTGSITNHGPADFDPGKDPVTVPAGYYSGGQVNGDANLIAEKIMEGETIFGVTGTYKGTSCTGVIWDDPGNPNDGNRWCVNGASTEGMPLVEEGDGTVTDMTTGLVWLRKADWGGQKKWDVESTGGNDDAPTRAGILKDGSANANLSDNSVAGDWRLPTKSEVDTFTHGDEGVRSGTPGPFSGVQSNNYWSSSTGSMWWNAWYVDLTNGDLVQYDKAYDLWVWPVRCGE